MADNPDAARLAAEYVANLRRQADSKVEVDTGKSIRLYVNSAPILVKQAETYMREGNLERAYILYYRFATLYVTMIKHPGYAAVERAQQQDLRQKCAQAMDLIEHKIGPMLKSVHAKRVAERIAAKRAAEAEAAAAAAAAAQQQAARAAEQARERQRQRQQEQEQRRLPAVPSSVPMAPIGHTPLSHVPLAPATPSAPFNHAPVAYPTLQPLGELPTYVPQTIPSVPPLNVQDELKRHDAPPPRPPPIVPPKPDFLTADDGDRGPHVHADSSPPIPPKPIDLSFGGGHEAAEWPHAVPYAPPHVTPPIPPKPAHLSTPAVTPKPEMFTDVPSYVEEDERMRQLRVPEDIIQTFLKLARPNTLKNLETCAILCGTLERDVLTVTHLVVPQQEATSDSCTTKNEELLLQFQDKHGLMTLGWIHTHPSQTCFMSSVDLHTHCSYQLMLPEAIAIVCAPKSEPSCGIFKLTDPPGLPYISKCRGVGFHPHELSDRELYADCTGEGFVILTQGSFAVRDLR